MSRIRIVCVSDTHGQHAKLIVPDGDVLIHAGDFMTFGDRPREIVDFNQRLGNQPHRHKLVIAGNHDLMFERHRGAARELLDNGIYLENSDMELMGLKIWGSPIQPEFNNWAFNVARGAAIRRYWKMIPANVDILVTHGPPFGVLDRAHPSTAHLGCEELLKAVEEIKPRLHVFGHIHGGHGSFTSNGTQFLNASVVNEAYRLVHEPQAVEIEILSMAHWLYSFPAGLGGTDLPRRWDATQSHVVLEERFGSVHGFRLEGRAVGRDQSPMGDLPPSRLMRRSDESPGGFEGRRVSPSPKR